jgi:hypothetical protein
MDKCIFENRPCEYAKNENGSFNCTSPSDDAMPCRKRANDTSHSVKCRSPYERTKRAVYATGNRWAIENFNATH